MLKEGILFQIKNEGSTKTIMFHNSIDSLPHVHPQYLWITHIRFQLPENEGLPQTIMFVEMWGITF